MGDRTELQSPVRRAKMEVSLWFEMLPKDAKVEAEMALDKLYQVACREVEQAYLDGHNQRSAAARLRKLMDDAVVVSPQ
jgi:hypothetical protein